MRSMALWVWLLLTIPAVAQDTITQSVDADILHRLTSTRPAAWHVIDPPDYRAAIAVADQREFILYTGVKPRTFVVLSFASAESVDEPPVSAKYIITVSGGVNPNPTPPTPIPTPPSIRDEYGVGRAVYESAIQIRNKDKHAEIADVFISAAEWLTAKNGTEAELQDCADRIGASFRARLVDRADWDATISVLSRVFQDNPKVRFKTQWQAAYREAANAIIAAGQR